MNLDTIIAVGGILVLAVGIILFGLIALYPEKKKAHG